jgi:hypothetical protein
MSFLFLVPASGLASFLAGTLAPMASRGLRSRPAAVDVPPGLYGRLFVRGILGTHGIETMSWLQTTSAA